MGSTGKKSSASTKAIFIENMNEQQLDDEIVKTKKKIETLDKILTKNDITNTSKAKAMKEAFPLGVGGDGWTNAKKKAKEKDLLSDAKKAKKYTEAYEEKEALQTKLKSLEKAKKQVAGTGKTQKELNDEKIKNLAKEPKTLKWKTVQKGGWVNGGYAPKIIKAGNIEIHGSSGLYTLFVNGVKIGNVKNLNTAKALAEKYKDKE